MRCAACAKENPPDARFCNECGARLEAPAEAAATPFAAPLPVSFASGRYAVRSFLGEGGRKRVYLAHDTRLDRDVAVAVIKTEGLDVAGLARVRNEAQSMARLGDYPNVVTVFDVGEEDDPSTSSGQGGQPYMVSQYMAGGSVEELIAAADDHRLPLDDAVRIATHVCQGLEQAHRRGIVHRDLKPGNIWLTGEGNGTASGSPPSPSTERGLGGEVRACVGDFGLAVALDRSRLTAEGSFVGTALYMAPEQALGQTPEPRSDLYSLGCVLYEMITGRPPFVGDDTVAVVTQHLNTPPVAPTWHRPDCPKGLEALILRLLEKDPANRPASAAEVRQALAAVDLSNVGATFRSPGGGAGDAAPTSAADPVYRQTFVGREAELRQLQNAFDGALSGQGALVMVVGEPGIGKTAVTEQLSTYVAMRGGRALHGNCYEEGSLSLPYLPFIEAMHSYVLSRDPEDLRAELGTNAGYVARIVSEVRDRIEVELPPAGDPEDERWRLLQAVTGFLRNAASMQPLVLILEDLHWSDKGTLDLLTHVARNLQGARLLVVGTYRDVEVDRTHPLSGALAELRRIGSFQRVTLRGLGAEDVRKMMSNIAGRDVPWQLAEQVHRQTEGNPFFVQEVMRYFVEEGLLARDEGGNPRRTTSETPLAMQIPEGLRDVIGKRISRLSPDCNRVLSVAAVIGRDFSFDVLTGVAGLPEESVLAAIEEAMRVGVLQEQSEAGAVRYRFAHAFFRQTLYEEMIAPRRLRLHQEVARALESQHARRLDEHAAELAEHFSYSTDAADLAKAVAYAERAAARAVAVFDYGEAARLLEKAIGVQEVLDPDDRAKRCDLLLAQYEPRRLLGDVDRARTFLFDAAAIARERHDSARLARVALAGRTWFGLVGVPDEAHRQLLEEGLAATPAEEGANRARLLLRLANEAGRLGDREESLRLAHEAELAAADTDDPAARVVVLRARMLALPAGPKSMTDRLALTDQIEAIEGGVVDLQFRL